MVINMIKHVFFDFNGTIIDDVDLCINLLNEILIRHKKPIVTKEKYKSIFTFPIKKYYELAGVDFNIESFDYLAVDFIEKYQPASYKCKLYDGSIETFKYLRNKGISTYILSASEKNNLMLQCDNFGITQYFDSILGIDNIHASSKIDIAREFMRTSNLNADEILFVGDTLHDYEVAKAMGVKCILVSCGHQAVDVLNKSGVKIINTIADLKEIL